MFTTINAIVTTGNDRVGTLSRSGSTARCYRGVRVDAWHRSPTDSNEQVGHEFGASQQYVAIAVHYDAQTLPRLAAHFYRQAVEERNHAMMLVQYLLDADEPVLIPGVEAPQTEFADVVEPVRLALEQEKRVTEQISASSSSRGPRAISSASSSCTGSCRSSARRSRRWRALLTVVERSQDNVMLVEDYLARETVGDGGADAGARPRPAALSEPRRESESRRECALRPLPARRLRRSRPSAARRRSAAARAPRDRSGDGRLRGA